MKKEANSEFDDDLRAEYDFAQLQESVKGKYVKQYKQGTNLVLLAPDLKKAFPTDEAVNEALRLLLRLAKSQLEHLE